MHPEIAPSRLDRMTELLPPAEVGGTVLLPHLDSPLLRLIAHALAVRGFRLLVRTAPPRPSPLGVPIPIWEGQQVRYAVLETSSQAPLSGELIAKAIRSSAARRLVVLGAGPPQTSVLDDLAIETLRTAKASCLLLRFGSVIEARDAGPLTALVETCLGRSDEVINPWGAIHAEDLAVATALALTDPRKDELWVGMLAAETAWDLVSGLEAALAQHGHTPDPARIAWVRERIPPPPRGPLFSTRESLWDAPAIGRILAHLWKREQLWRGPDGERRGQSPFQINGQWWRLSLEPGRRERDLASGLCSLDDPASGTYAGVMRLARGRWWSAREEDSVTWNTVDGKPQLSATLDELLTREAAWDPPLAPTAAWRPREFWERILELGFDDRWIATLIRFGARNGVTRPNPSEIARWT